jgi:DNA repair protein RecN (Recombination protein N)
MLLELRVANLALAADVVLPFGTGLTVLTGETGAGKSLIAGALALLCGGPSDKGLGRSGEEGAVVEGLFDLTGCEDVLTDLRRLGVAPSTDGVLVLRREIRREGRSRVLINGSISSLSLLERIGPRLLAVQSQDQQRELSDPGFVRRLLDRHLDLGELVKQVSQRLAEFRTREEELTARRSEAEFAREQLDLWRYQFEELDRAQLAVDEEERLAEQLSLIRHASALREGAAAALQAISANEPSAHALLSEATAAVEALADKSKRLADVAEDLALATEMTTSAASALHRFLDGFEMDPRQLGELEERTALYAELRRKYRRDVEDLLELRDELRVRLERQQDAGSDLTERERRCEVAREQLAAAVQQLHTRRVEGATGFARAARRAVQRLALPDLELEIAVTVEPDPQGPITLAGERCQVARHGADRVQLRVRTNPGERMGDVGAIASGGERSRIHLGLTALVRDRRDPPLLLFDEIDAGLGMDSAAPVARLLRELAGSGQVVCITHLPTMAVFGSQHLKVDKAVTAGRTSLKVRSVVGPARIEEVARLLGGEGYAGGDGAAQLSYAQELLATGGNVIARAGAAGEPA